MFLFELSRNFKKCNIEELGKAFCQPKRKVDKTWKSALPSRKS